MNQTRMLAAFGNDSDTLPAVPEQTQMNKPEPHQLRLNLQQNLH
uniref:Uncharacterized protein n=1 Tax=Candidatus Kentrum sp. MB TaxID=2138164 RepID=A0A450XYU2_9GAMM|nr:MAG: hypothetical protein BECKMB1821G_GA0114241_106511 [Candidatus Kentron sp. MB]VFK34413.1 MAG: hypothetical protein BECKMB1821I_GA0114274_107111 [Candidatus Kentron sp. MB]VFK76707.1 MAG: hypothetical protein BECKMB1821H_GA0114242_107011 [Candidatus Kentron sp. MB]